jgi:demethylmenaquinone methyltransferase/2-methoxy-6-polyprenyl-1,4-benzoquinol methylase
MSGLLESQRRYYDLRADDYGDATAPADRTVRGFMSPDDVAAIVDDLAPTGAVLELACGPGGFTRELVRHADTVTAVDASARMIERNRREIAEPSVEYVCADLFTWRPGRRFDLVFFGFWLSHVPPTEFDRFWSVLRTALRPGGRVAFVDEDTRATAFESSRTDDGVPAARRRLADGTEYEIVKVFRDPPELESRLAALGWDARVRSFGASFLVGEAR